MTTMLSRNFSLDEMLFSQTAAREGIANVPDQKDRHDNVAVVLEANGTVSQ